MSDRGRDQRGEAYRTPLERFVAAAALLVIMAAAAVHAARIPVRILGTVAAVGACFSLTTGILCRVRRVDRALEGIVLVLSSLVLTASSLHDLPRLVDRATAYAVSLGPFCLAVHAAVVAVVTLAATTARLRMSEVCLVALIGHSALNGRVFAVLEARVGLLWGIGLLGVIAVLREGEPWRGDRLTRLTVAAFLAWTAVSVAFAVYPHDSATVVERLLLWGLSFFLVAHIAADARGEGLVSAAVLGSWVVVAGGAIAGVVAYAQAMGVWAALTARAGLATMHANGLGAVCASGTLLAAGLAWSGRARLPSSLAAGLFLVVLVLTGSRSSVVGALGGLAVALVATRPRVRAAWVVVAAVVVATGVVFLSRRDQGELEGRWTIWTQTLRVVAKRPLVGTGPGTHLPPAFLSDLPPFLRREDPLPTKDFLATTRTVGWHAHNVFLEVAETTGLVGLVLLIATGAAVSCVGRTGRDGSPMRAAFAAAFASMVIAHMGELCLGAGTLLPAEWFVLLGALAGTGSTPGSRPARLGRGVALGIVLLGALLFCARPSLMLVLGAPVAKARGKAPSTSPARLSWAMRLSPLDAELRALAARSSEGTSSLHWWREAVRLRPWFAPYRSQLAWELWAEGDLEAALSEFSLAASLDRFGLDGGTPVADLGIALVAAGSRADGLAVLRDAALVDPGSFGPPLWCRVGERVTLHPAFDPPGGPSEDLAALIATRLDPHVRPCDATGTLELDEVLGPLVHPLPNDTIVARHALGSAVVAWERCGVPSRVRTLLDSLEAITPPRTLAAARIKSKRSRALANLGLSQQALEEARHALESFEHPLFHHRLGMLYVRRKRYDEAIPHLEKAALSWDPRAYFDAAWPRYWSDLAEAYSGAARYEDALRALATARFLGLGPATYVSRSLAVTRLALEAGRTDAGVRGLVDAMRTILALAREGTVETQLQEWVLLVRSSTDPSGLVRLVREEVRMPRALLARLTEASTLPEPRAARPGA